jgi:hypothetical protein
VQTGNRPGPVEEVIMAAGGFIVALNRHFLGAAAAAAVWLASPPAAAETSVDDLKRAYLACERAAAASRQGDGEIMHCSVVYEELKQRGFGGDYQSLRIWHEARRQGVS